MLVLRRKVGESVVLDGGITVTVNAVEGGRVKLAFSAPPHIRIWRKELLRSLAAPQEESHV